MRATPADPIHPGLNLLKLTTYRRAQVSAVTPTHAILYWPDTDQQTAVKLERFNRANEWKIRIQ